LKKKIVIVFLTFNSKKIIRNSIKSAKKLTDEIIIVDSFSTDKTVQICKKLGCKIFQRKFKNYSNQRNWIINKINNNYKWQLHLDADEIMDRKLLNSIKKIIDKDENEKCFLIKKKYFFLNRPLKYPGLNKWHLRLFKSHTTRCEKRAYDQHFVSKYKTKNILTGNLLDQDRLNFSRWKEKHLNWAIMEASESYNKKNKKKLFNKDDPRYKIRKLKNFYYQLPILLRPFLYFFYRYFYKQGFKDGKIGFLFSFYHAFWFRFQVDINIIKLTLRKIKIEQ